MIFVDTNVFMCAVGRERPLRDEARAVFGDPSLAPSPVTSAEVLPEYLVARHPGLGARDRPHLACMKRRHVSRPPDARPRACGRVGSSLSTRSALTCRARLLSG